MKRKQLWLVPVFVLALSLPGLAQTDGEREILQREQAWREALLKASNKLEDIYSQNLSYNDWNGTTHARTTIIADVKSGRLKYQALKARAETVQISVNTAIYTCEIDIAGNYGETSISRVAKLLHIWVKEAGTWRLLVHQTQKPN